MQNILKIKLDEGAVLPRKAHASDIGYDLSVMSAELEFLVKKTAATGVIPLADVELVKVPLQDFLEKGYAAVSASTPGAVPDPRPRRLIVDTGVHVEPPAGYWVEVAANSRVVKLGMSMANCVGIIDPDYRGSIRIFFTITDAFPIAGNLSKMLPGNVCGQMILRRAHEADILQVDELSDTVRGSGGFGSTAK